MKHPPYPRYKASGIDWLGDVPDHWDIKSIKWISPVLRGASPRPIDDPKYFDDDGEFAWVRIADVSASDGVLRESFQTLSKLGASLSVKLKPGDLFVSIAGTVGKPCITSIKACIHDGFVYFPLLRIDPRFFYRIFEAGTCYGGLGKMGTQLNLNTDTIGSIRIAIPPEDELASVLAFVDRETAKLDTLIAKKQTLVERLKEKRTALISHTVTRGLPPDAARAAGLDPHPKMKPSGIDWLGEVPEHWSVLKFSRAVRIAEGQVNPEDEPYSSMLLIAPNHISSGTGRLDQFETAADQGAESGKYKCNKGNVVYSKIRPALCKATIAPEDCLCSADMYPMDGRGDINNRYLLWLLLSSQFTGWSVLEADRVAMPKINRDTLCELRMPAPPMDEQQIIADFLDRETAKIDQLIAKVETAIERLQEYRSALITAAVTGKIDVRGEAACKRDHAF